MELSNYEKNKDKGAKSAKSKSKKSGGAGAGKTAGKVTMKQFVRDMIAENKSETDVKTAIVDKYVSEGKEKPWAEKRAKAIFADISNEV